MHTMHNAFDLPAIDPAGVDWGRVRTSRYLVHQRFRYEYPARILDLQHQLVVIPPSAFGDQTRMVYSVEVSEPGEVITTVDSFANTVLDVRIPVVEHAIEFGAWVTLERSGPPAARPLPASWLNDERLLTATVRTAVDEAIEAAALELLASGARGLALATLVNTWVHQKMRYEQGVTGIRTTAGDALAGGAGVCQDYSHIMLALCRRMGLASLYVSGHLIGEGGTHSWVEVLLPTEDGSGAEGWSFDPTHGRCADLTYLTVAVGRDYADVAPTSGSYRAGHGGSLSGFKEVRVIDVAY